MKLCIRYLGTLSLILTLLLPTDLFAGEGDNGYLIITIYTSSNSKDYNKIIVTEGDNVLEELSFDRWTFKEMTSRALEVNKIINKYEKSGYDLFKISKGSIDNFTSETIILFTKE